jgi:hypothetical protein
LRLSNRESGERMQPTAQAVGTDGLRASPGGAKELIQIHSELSPSHQSDKIGSTQNTLHPRPSGCRRNRQTPQRVKQAGHVRFVRKPQSQKLTKLGGLFSAFFLLRHLRHLAWGLLPHWWRREPGLYILALNFFNVLKPFPDRISNDFARAVPLILVMPA